LCELRYGSIVTNGAALIDSNSSTRKLFFTLRISVAITDLLCIFLHWLGSSRGGLGRC